MKIGVIGIGKLGICFSLLLEKSGFIVNGSDVNSDYCNEINNRTLISSEPGLKSLLDNFKNLSVTTDNIDLIKKSDVIFTFVQTPSTTEGGYNHSNIEDIINQFTELYNNNFNLNGKIFVIGCTTMPNYTDTVSKRLSKYGVHVCYNPEFIAQGEILNGLEMSDMVLIGSDSEYASNKLKTIYKSFMKINPKFNVMSNTAAEITKISINCFLTNKISFANMIGEICIKSGISNETENVLLSIGDDSRIGNKYLKFGYGFGGPCLPRDNRALGRHMENINLKINLPYEVDKFNYNHNDFLYNQLITENPDTNIPFIFNTVSYKKGIDIITESQQLKLAETLLSNGHNVIIIDIPQVLQLIQKDLKTKYGEKVILSSENNYSGYNINI